MGLFDKKNCDICGEKIGLLGNRKLDDGNLCKNCAAKLSPWFSDRRRSTVEDIRAQLEYREENREAVAAFQTTRSFGSVKKVLLDENAGKFTVSGSRNMSEENPDILEFTQVTGCNMEVSESRSEEQRKTPDGKMVSYNPPRYTYSYNLFLIIQVNHPYFDSMRVKMNRDDIESAQQMPTNISLGTPFRMTAQPNGIGRNQTSNANAIAEFQAIVSDANEIKKALMTARQDARDTAAAESTPKQAVQCPCCGALTTPDAAGCCEYCGSPL